MSKIASIALGGVLFVLSSTQLAAQSTDAGQNPPELKPVQSATAESVAVSPAKEGDAANVRIVCKLHNLSANNVAQTIQKVFSSDRGKGPQLVNGLVIAPENISNCIILSGPQPLLNEIQRLIHVIDQPSAIVRIKVQIAESVLDDKKKDAPSDPKTEKTAKDDTSKQPDANKENGGLLASAEIATLGNQEASVQFGRQEPRITGVASGPGGRNNNSFSYQNVGTQIKVTPRVSNDGIIAAYLDIQDSRSGSPDEGVAISVPEKGSEIRAVSTDTLHTQVTLHLREGQPVVISGITSYGKTRKITVTANLEYPGGKK
jgi:type II secretory pathway component GspD/PulD (secretin)